MSKLEIIDREGRIRRMGNIPSPVKAKWTPFGEAGKDTPALIPEDEWKDRIDELNQKELDAQGLPPTHDQNGRGQCNADATTAFMEYLRAIEGMDYVKLSAGDLYGRINGGNDNGSLLEDAMAAMLDEGVGEEETYGGPLWTPGNEGCPEDQRARYKLDKVFVTPTPAHVMSASLQGFAGVVGIFWYQNFIPDNLGCLPVNGGGDHGGHALFRFPGAKYIERRGKLTYYVPLQNSWRVDWTHWQGRCWLPINHLTGEVGGHWSGLVAKDTDADVFPPQANKSQNQRDEDDEDEDE